MFERLQKPFLTVETGEAYQPIRLTYQIFQKDQLIQALNSLKCCEKNPAGNTWNWYWRDECSDIGFESITSYSKNPDHPLRLGTFTLQQDALYLNLPSFKRACLAAPFFHRTIKTSIARIHLADFINKIFSVDERLPHGYTELFKVDELDRMIHQRISDYEKVQTKCEHAASADEALAILSDYTRSESQKRLPYAERYTFDHAYTEGQDPEVVFLSFYIFLRGRELVAIKRWYGDSGYSLFNAAEDTVDEVFGGMNIDVIE